MINYYEEGDTCPEDGCNGTLIFERLKNCYCHICPPCHHCESRKLYCPICGWVDE
jgi:hypothetical protein